MNNQDIEKIINKLIEEIVSAEKAYYVENRPIMSDGEFDNKMFGNEQILQTLPWNL